MKSGIYLSSILIVVLCATFAFAQGQDPIGLTDFPVPAWPEDGVVAPELKDKYVFIDIAKNEYVVAYPENLGAETFAADGPGPLRISRYDLLRNVEPRVTLTVTPGAAGRLKYVYTVSNAADAKQSIDALSIVLPEQAGHSVIRMPAGWMAVVQNGRSFKLKNPEWIRNGTAAVWSFMKPEAVIQPGGSVEGFELESELRPGFVVGYFRKSESVAVKVATHGNVPKEVKDQIDSILGVEYNSKTLLTLGPKFDRNTDDQAIAADYVQGIFTLSREGSLNLNSEFVRAALNALTGVQPGARGATVRIAAQPRTPAETELLNALEISLKVN